MKTSALDGVDVLSHAPDALPQEKSYIAEECVGPWIISPDSLCTDCATTATA
jgi:hypothetical protein